MHAAVLLLWVTHVHGRTCLWQEQASLSSPGQGQLHVGVQEACVGVDHGGGVQPLPAGVLDGAHRPMGHAAGGPGPLLALVLLQAGLVAALALAAGADEALAGREPASALDVAIDFRVGALHARLAVHGAPGRSHSTSDASGGPGRGPQSENWALWVSALHDSGSTPTLRDAPSIWAVLGCDCCTNFRKLTVLNNVTKVAVGTPRV